MVIHQLGIDTVERDQEYSATATYFEMVGRRSVI